MPGPRKRMKRSQPPIFTPLCLHIIHGVTWICRAALLGTLLPVVPGAPSHSPSSPRFPGIWWWEPSHLSRENLELGLLHTWVSSSGGARLPGARADRTWLWETGQGPSRQRSSTSWDSTVVALLGLPVWPSSKSMSSSSVSKMSFLLWF